MLAFSCRRDLANLSERRKPGDGRCPERSERQRTAPGETRRTMAKRASAASDFGHRPRVAEVRPAYIALMLGGRIWVGVPELPRFITNRHEACNSLLVAVLSLTAVV